MDKRLTKQEERALYAGTIKGKPETVFVAITCQDGSVAIMQYVTKQQRTLVKDDAGNFIDPGWTREASAENINAEIAKSNINAVSWEIINPEDVPTDRTFRNAWKMAGKKLDIDMDKAREMTKERLRAERAPLLAAQDAEFMKALESGDKTRMDKVAAEKQKLRDITASPALAAAKTPDDLKAITV